MLQHIVLVISKILEIIKYEGGNKIEDDRTMGVVRCSNWACEIYFRHFSHAMCQEEDHLAIIH